MTARTIANVLQGRKCGDGWIAHCVAHDDRARSLSISDGRKGIIVHCFAGCSQEAVIEALRGRGLWPERENKPLTQEQKQDWAKLRDEQRAAEAWGRTAAALSEIILEQIGQVPERATHTRTIQIAREGGQMLVEEYRWHKQHYPKLVAAMVSADMRAQARAKAKTIKLLGISAVDVALKWARDVRG